MRLLTLKSTETAILYYFIEDKNKRLTLDGVQFHNSLDSLFEKMASYEPFWKKIITFDQDYSVLILSEFKDLQQLKNIYIEYFI